MSGIFHDLKWAIVIFDNILILANGFQELYDRIDVFLDRCIQFNVTLKITKTWLGFLTVKFFGYLCRKGSYEFTEDRKQSLTQIPFSKYFESNAVLPWFRIVLQALHDELFTLGGTSA